MWTNWPSPRLQSRRTANLCSPLTSRADNEERAESAVWSTLRIVVEKVHQPRIVA